MPGSCTRLQTCFGSQTYTFWGEWGRLGQCHQNPSQEMFPSMQEGYPVTCIPVCKGKQPAQIFSEHKENWAGLVWECAEILTSVRENRRPSLPQQQQGLPYCYQEVVPGVWRPTLQAGNQGCAFPYLQLRWDWCAGPFFVLQGNFRGGDWLSATDISGPDRMAQFLPGVLSYLWNIAPIEKKVWQWQRHTLVYWFILSSGARWAQPETLAQLTEATCWVQMQRSYASCITTCHSLTGSINRHWLTAFCLFQFVYLFIFLFIFLSFATLFSLFLFVCQSALFLSLTSSSIRCHLKVC